MQDEFSEKIKEWVSTDNMVRLYMDKIRELRSERNEIAENILVYAEKHLSLIHI